MLFATYDPKQTILDWGGLMVVGFAEGSMITIEQAEDDYEMSSGAAGDVVLRRMQNPTGSVTFRLQAESPSNSILGARATTSRRFAPVVLPVMIRNLGQLTQCAAPFACLSRPANVEWAAEAGVREWVLLTAGLEILSGGAIALPGL
jgi:hypothetical protein